MKKLLLVMLSCLLAPSSGVADRSPEFRLNLLFVNGTAGRSNDDLESTIKTWVDEAERQYRTRPALKISYTIEKRTSAAGRSLAKLSFDSPAAFGGFMDDHFDNYARSETDGHLTLLVGDQLCITNLVGKRSCWGGMAFFPHDVNPFNRKRGIWLSQTGDSRLLAHELGHFFSLKHTFEPYFGLNKQCNKDFGKKNLFNPSLGHCNSCTGTISVRGSGANQYYVCENGTSNVMDYCTSLEISGAAQTTGPETLNVCQQERAATQREQYLTGDGHVSYLKLAGLRGGGTCTADTQCHGDEYCTAGILDLTRNHCKDKKAHGATCTNKRQCASGRCSWGFCADADECRAESDCGSSQYCGDPISGKRKCKELLGRGKGCTKGSQCASGKCSFFTCDR